MTATAYKLDGRHIKESLGLHSCFELVANSAPKEYLLRKGIQIQALILMPWRTFADQFML
jgi:hypothetical protein